MLFTSYFARVEELRGEGIVPVSIALYTPKDFDGIQYPFLSPTKEILTEYKKGGSMLKYIQEFKRTVLDIISAKITVETLQRITQSSDIALCCYEKSGEFCHRNLVADWFNSFGYDCEEYDFWKIRNK